MTSSRTKSEAGPSVAQPSYDRIFGSLLGGALGDALGYPIEFEKPGHVLLARYGAAPPEDLAYATGGGVISDDTQMTLFTAEGLIRADARLNERGVCSTAGCLLRAYHRWYFTQSSDPRYRAPWGEGTAGWVVDDRRLWQRRAPGVTCLAALKSTLDQEPHGPGNPINTSKGCGAVMRVAPIGLVASTREVAFEIGVQSGAITHGHPSGYLSAGYMASLVWDLSRGATMQQASVAADALLGAHANSQEVLAALVAARKIATCGVPDVSAIEALGEGWVAEEALAIAVLCASTVEGSTPTAVASALWRSVLHGGDSDSTGSLTGNLLGAMYGAGPMPERWAHGLEALDLIERLSRDLFSVFVMRELDAFRYYPPN